MNEQLFAELIASVKEGGAILRGEAPASRSFELDPADIKSIREGFGLTQVQFTVSGRRPPPGSGA